MMGRRLATRGVEVESMISSPAVRAMTTAEAVAEELEYPWEEIVADEGLYEADAEEILAVIEEQDDWIDHLMIVAHNPGVTTLANMLSGAYLENVPTGGVVVLRYEVDRWEEVVEAKPVRVTFDYPKKGQR